MNDQRTAIYAERLKILSGEGVRETFHTMLENVVEEITEGLAPEKVAGSEWDWAAVNEELMTQFGFQIELSDDEKDGLSPDAFYDMVLDKAEKLLSAKETEFTPTVYDYLLRQILITTLDHLWKDHLLAMDHLREGINLRAYGQKDPKQEYKKEGHQMFQEMVAVFRADVVEKMCKVQVRREVVAQQPPPQPGTVEPQTQVQPTAGTTEPTVETGPAPAPSPTLGQPLAAPKQERKLVYSHGSDGAPRDASKKEPVKGAEKVGRNEPCPCGSGKKYKQCHGKTAVTS
jgi:preprotein translocase subunit SecA